MRSAPVPDPQSIFWLITKLTAAAGSTTSDAHAWMYAYRPRTSSRVVSASAPGARSADYADHYVEERPDRGFASPRLGDGRESWNRRCAS
jgi:hypothetical protein